MAKHKENKELAPEVFGAVPRVAVLSTTAFYALVVLEFFYMASPFAAYFYSAYGPGLDWLGNGELTAWTTRFFLPHIVSQTTSILVNSHTLVGLVLLLFGLFGFTIGAYRVYRGKFNGAAIIQSGVYNYIRHPQYSSLIIASFGTLLIWPRMLAVVGFALVIVLYIALAKSEEKRCEMIDPSYKDYRNRTGFLLPRALEAPARFTQVFLKHLPRFAYWPFTTAICLTVLLVGSQFVKNWSTNKIQGIYSTAMATISIGDEPVEKVENVLTIAQADSSIANQLDALKSKNTRFLNYVLPIDMYVSEVPMNLPPGATTTHHYDSDASRTRFKIIFTEAVLPPNSAPEGIDILREAINKTPVAEVWVDLQTQLVEKTLPPTPNQFYNRIPVPVF